ncbi:MAG: conjugal transfer protein TraF [Proteobacteria bacterium]|nr:conjugal transfer protein TraF [Pseudomonadota bacterium]
MIHSRYSAFKLFWKTSHFLGLLVLLLSLVSSLAFLKADSLTQPHKKPEGSLKAETHSLPNIRWRAQPSFFGGRAEGWHWYQDSDQSSEISDQKKPLLNPTQVIEEQRKALETKLHAAIIEPTHENLIAYITAQRALMDQSQRFSEEWKKVVMATPVLDETLIHPTDQNARHIYYNERSTELSKRIKALANDYGLFFFFRKNCPYCHHFAPIVKRFSQKYGWSVLAISMDGGPLRSSLPEFPDAREDNGISKRLQVSHVPALIAFHPKTKQLVPLAYGMISESEIEERVLLWFSGSGSLGPKPPGLAGPRALESRDRGSKTSTLMRLSEKIQYHGEKE